MWNIKTIIIINKHHLNKTLTLKGYNTYLLYGTGYDLYKNLPGKDVTGKSKLHARLVSKGTVNTYNMAEEINYIKVDNINFRAESNLKHVSIV